MPVVSGGEWHVAWIWTFGKILVLTLSCGIINVASTFSCEIWSNLVKFSWNWWIWNFGKKVTTPGVKISEETPQLLLKYQQQKTQLPKKPVTSKELRLHPCGPSLQGFHSKGSSPMPAAVSGGEWHAAWIATFGKILVLTLSCGVVNVASLFRVKGRLVLRGIWWYILALMTSGHVQLQPLVV